MKQSKRWTRVFLYLFSLPVDLLFGWPIVLFCRLAWGEALTVEDGVLRCRAKRGSWLNVAWGHKWAGVTLAPHAILYFQQPLWPEELSAPSETQEHEHVHVEQGEAAQLRAFVVALVVLAGFLIVDEPVWAAVLGLLRWATGHHEKAGAAALTALLRGEDGYRGSHIEEAARGRPRRRTLR